MKKIVFLFVAYLFFDNVSVAQSSQQTSLIKPSPVAASIERFTDYPVSLYTGVPEISIPIFDITIGDVVVPIKLSYHASGIKEDDQSHPVGLGWSLMAGGRISRTVRDKPDDKAPALNPYFTEQSPDNSNDRLVGMQIETNLFTGDKQADLFHINSGIEGGYSGRFIFDGAKKNNNNGILSEPLFFPSSNLKFNPVYSSIYYYNNALKEIGIVDEKGVRYKYGGENGIYTEWQGLHALSISSWLINEIMPSGRDSSRKINFFYKEGPLLSTTTYEGFLSIIDSICVFGGNQISSNLDGLDFMYVTYPNSPASFMNRIEDVYPALIRNPNTATSNQSHLSEYRQQIVQSYEVADLDSISFPHGSVKLVYDPQTSLLDSIKVLSNDGSLFKVVCLFQSKYGTEERYKLDSVVIHGGVSVQRYKMEYKPGIGYRHPFARDFWGYYNGVTLNETLLPLWNNVPVVMDYRKDINGNDVSIRSEVQIGNAARSASGAASENYILSKITHPTSGTTEYEFEPNMSLGDPDSLVTGVFTSLVGGARVKSITHNPIQGKSLKRKFFYGVNRNGLGIPNNYPTYQNFSVESNVGATHYPVPCSQSPGCINYLPITPIIGRKREFFTSPNRNLNQLDGSPVWYAHVEESDVNESGIENGLIKYEFLIPPKDVEIQKHQNGNPVSPFFLSVINGYRTPLLKRKSVYDGGKLLSEDIKEYLSKASDIYYSVSSAKWLTVNERMSGAFAQTDQLYHNIGYEYIWAGYSDISSEIRDETWYPLTDSSIVYDYSGSGDPIKLISVTEYGYNRSETGKGVDFYPSEISSNSSSGESIVKHFVYPMDLGAISSSDELSLGYKNLLDNNIVSVPVETVTTKGGSISGTLRAFSPIEPKAKTEYSFSATSLDPTFQNLKNVSGSVIKDSRYLPEVQIDKYDLYGNVEQLRPVHASPVSYVWGYNGTNPIAEVLNAEVSKVAYTSFEDQGLGGWNLISGGVYLTNNNNITGKRSLSGGVSKTLPQGNYVLSFWSAANTWVNGTAFTDQPVKNLGNGRRYFEKILTNVTSVQVSGDNIDEVRIYPIGAQMSTYTYNPLIGMTSRVDAAGNITYYEYDSFGRLSMVRDEKQNILKRICYNYAGQPEACKLFYNTAKSQTFTRNNCGSGYVGGSYTYTVPANTYVGSSQAEADQLALNDIAQNGQTAANSNATCTQVFQSVDVSGYYFNQNCPSGTGTPVYVYMPAGSYTSTVSQQYANDDAVASAQAYADANGGCSAAEFYLNGSNSTYEGMTIVLINTSTWENLYFYIYPNTNYASLLGMITPGFYHINIMTNNSYNWFNYNVGSYYGSFSGSTTLYDVYLDEYFNYINIY